MTNNNKRLIIIDSSALLYRAFHALPPLTNKKGQPTGAAYGFLLTLFRAMKDIKANYVAACFDTAKPTFRHKEFSEYKAHRPPTPEGIILQMTTIKEVLKAFNIPIFEKEGFEADDLIATIAEKAKKENINVYIVSGDLDGLQLVGEKVKLYTLGRGVQESVIYDEKKVIERFGVKPEQMNDFKALTGDASDNVPGVPGIGKTTAAELIQKYGSVEGIYSELATDTAVLKPKVKDSLKVNKESALLSLRLVKTDKNVELDFILENCKFSNFDEQKVKNIFNELGFQSLIKKIQEIKTD